MLLRSASSLDGEVQQSLDQFRVGSPDASQSFGYIEIDVNPGIVFSSLSHGRSSPSRKKSTRAIPAHGSCGTLRPRAADLLEHLRLQVGRDQQLRAVLVEVLRVVVVELVVLGHDLARDGRDRLVVAEDAHSISRTPSKARSTSASRA